jgi:AcrR family transcriptional regulator
VSRPKIHDDALRVELIEAAARILVAEGPHSLSTRRIAGEVGTSTTAIYSLLGSKSGLMRAMYLEGFGRLATRQNAVPRTEDPVADLRALGLAYFENGVANPNLYDVMFHRPVQEFTPEPADVAFALTTLQDVVDLAQRCIDDGFFVGEATDIATEVWAVVHGLTSLTLTCMIEEPAARSRLGHLMRVTTDGFRAEAAS